MHGYFFVYKRTLKSGNKIYYYQAYKPDGTLAAGKSTGCKTKAAAMAKGRAPQGLSYFKS